MARARGEGTTYQRTDGRWVSEVTVAWRPNGDGGMRRVRKRVLGHSAEDAAAKRMQLVTAKQLGLPIPGGQFTVDGWMRHWLTTICPGRVRPSTLRTYWSYFNNWVTPAIGPMKLRELRAEHLDALYAHMRREGRAAASQLQVHRIITRALQVALQREHVARNIGSLVDAPTGPSRPPKWLDIAQLQQLLATSAGDRLRARWAVAIALGLRQGEALGLCWTDVDLTAGTLAVARQLVRVPGTGVQMGPLKTIASERVLAMPATLVSMLREHRLRQLEERIAEPAWTRWRSAGVEHDLVFAQPNGRPIDHARDYRNWRALLERAGIPPMPLHSARHTTATMLLISGVPLPIAAGYLGQASTRMTERYTHVVSSQLRGAADQMESTMWG